MNKPRYKPWVYNLLPVLVWFLLLVLPFVSSPPNMPEWMRHHFITNIVTSNIILLILFYIHTYLLYPLLQKRGWPLYLTSLTALLACYWVYWWLFRGTPPRPPGGSFPQNWKDSIPNRPGDTNPGRRSFGPQMGRGPGIFMPILSPFIALLCSFCYRIILDNNARQQALKERETVHLRTELSFLRSQINPHFLFNVLNNLTSLARKKSDQVEPAIMNLSHLMRYMLYESDDNRVLLDKEIAYLNSYIELQLLRFGSELKVKADMAGDYSAYHIGPMLLIALVENAFKHGTDTLGQTTIHIALKIPAGERKLYFSIVNEIQQQENPPRPSGGIGLKNVKRRLYILYPGKHQLTTTNTGTLFSAELTIELD
ncbi:histidine kinase [Mucilaginibacter sp.]|uniref:sensor histidine kinase n=1 Tax=Mucilaginibacter sp. TaxID=1882438 RepID=UPI0032660D7D